MSEARKDAPGKNAGGAQPVPRTEPGGEAGLDGLVELAPDGSPAAAAGKTMAVRAAGLHLGRLVGLAPGRARVQLKGEEDAVDARVAAEIGPADLGHEVVVLLTAPGLEPGVLLGRVQNEDPAPWAEAVKAPAQLPTRGERLQLEYGAVDFTAAREIVLRCGKASITLNADGKVVVRGTRLLNRASGVNRIMGGSVQIN